MRTPRDRTGFTLLEILVVIAIIAVALTLTLPDFLPAIARATLEGNARHLAAYGRGVMEHCILMHEYFGVKIDLDNQEYWSVQHILIQEDEEDQSALEKTAGMLDEDTLKSYFEESGMAVDMADVLGKMRGGETRQDALSGISEEAQQGLDWQAERMRKRFWAFQRISLEAQAKNVEQEGFLDEIQPLFEDDFSLQDDEKAGEEKEQEVMIEGLSRTKLPEDVIIERVRVGSEEYLEGEVTIDITPSGLAEPVSFYLRSGDDYFTVAWDPVTRHAVAREGQDAELYGREIREDDSQ